MRASPATPLLALALVTGASACTSILGSFDFDGKPAGTGGAGATSTSSASGTGGMNASSSSTSGSTGPSGSSSGATGGGGAASSSSASGTASSSSSSGMVCATSPCSSDADCPASLMGCITPSCNTAIGCCMDMDVDAGAPAPMQKAGTCQQNVCDGMGGVTSVPDPTNTPAPMDACHTGTCSGGTVVQHPIAGPCAFNGGSVCGDPAGSAAGQCVACNMTSDCAQPANACVSVVCSTNACVPQNQGPGTMCTGAGVSVCNGAGTCVQCNTANDCTGGQGCSMNHCVAASCSDMMKDGNETDVDCGGVCPACAVGKMCMVLADCFPNNCKGGICVMATCSDGILDGSETDVDCGGSCTQKCADGKLCGVSGDCLNNDCFGGHCVSCMDGVKDGNETDVDCGGSCAQKCADLKHCSVNTDCVNGDCAGGTCVSCMDGVKDGNETDVDCGGATCDTAGATCLFGKKCGVSADCYSGFCNSGVCDAITLASAQQYPRGIAIDANNVYWTDYNSGTVWKVPKVGGTAVQICTTITPDPNAVAVDAVNVYWVTDYLNGGSGDVWKAPIAGGTAGTRLATGQGFLNTIAIDPTYVYYADSNGGVVRKVAIAGGTMPVVLASGLNGSYGIAVDATYVYWTADDGTVVRQTLNGGARITLAALGSSASPGPIVVDQLRAYFGTFLDNNVYQVSIFTANQTPLSLANMQGSTGGIAVDSTSVYWVSPSSNYVAKALIGGGGYTILSSVLGTGPQDIAVDGTDVYYTNGPEGTVRHMHK